MFTYPYPMTAGTATVALLRAGGEVLICQRGSTVDTYPSRWCLPGGFINAGKENGRQAACREVKEETGLTIDLKDLRLFDEVSDPDADPRYHVINLCYYSWLGNIDGWQDNVVPGDDIQACEWVTIQNVLQMSLVFKHDDVLRTLLTISGERRL